MNTIKAWLLKDAKWWEFWMPGSGFFGGVIMGAILWTLVLTIKYLSS